MSVLQASDDELSDLAQGGPRLVEASSGQFTGISLVRWLGAGGMSAVFLADLDLARRSADLSPLSPRRLALKLTKISTERQLRSMNIDPLASIVREIAALGRVMDRKPPTEFVVGFYGSGLVDVKGPGGAVRRLPWLAIEHIDGGTAGVTLSGRVHRTVEGVDPVRALRLVTGLFEGVRVLHGEGVLHRDLKPDNVFVAGPVDDETPKLADCGIARVDGLLGGTIQAMTPAYGGPEQILSLWRPTESNPLIGPWTDIHALAAVLWFIIAGEEWCRSDGDQLWHAGDRRSLRTASERLHVGYSSHPAALGKLDEVLRRGASHRLPDAAWQAPGAANYERMARARFAASMFAGPERYATVDAFAADLLPLLADLRERWEARAARENKASTAFRPTHMLAAGGPGGEPLATVTEQASKAIRGTEASLTDATLPPTAPGSVVFQPDGKLLARFGDRLLYFVEDKPHKVAIPAELQADFASCRWLVRGPGGGFALVGPGQVVLVRAGRFTRMPVPSRPGGGEVGEIVAVLGEGRVFGVLTAETDDSNGGPELWRSVDGASWSGPVVAPLGGLPLAVADGPFGFLVVGCSANRKRARALFLGMDDQAKVFTTGVNERAVPLTAALCSAGRDSWAAGAGLVLHFDAGHPTEEPVEASDEPVHLGLDIVGVPWLVTSHAVLRRHVDAGQPAWKLLYRRDSTRPRLVGVGFTPEGAQVLDERGGGVRIVPRDIDAWRERADTSLLLGLRH
jgi:serine/threonine protein kinase